MKEHILESGEESLQTDQVTIVPNAVDAEEFPIQDRDPALAARLGIPEGAVVIGYISSMVTYESIETLIDGFKVAAGRTSAPVHLLLVRSEEHTSELQSRGHIVCRL